MYLEDDSELRLSPAAHRNSDSQATGCSLGCQPILMSSSEQKRCLACCGMLLVLAIILTLYLAGSQHAIVPLSVLRLRRNLATATDISAQIASRADQPPMPMTSTLRAQLAGHVHNEPWARNTELNISTQISDSSQKIPQHVYVSVIQRDFIVSQSIANCKQLNPGFTFHIMDDTDIQKFVEQKAPTLLPIFNQLQGVERSDFWRYLVLWSQGGYYIDSDINCLKPFTAWDDAFLHRAKAIIGIESINPGSDRNHLGFCCPVQYTNWAMASAPGHLLFEHVIDVILDFYAVANRDESSLEAQRRGRDHIVYKTGPGALSRAVEHYLALFDEYSLDVATGHHAEIVGDVGVFPKFALASPKISTAVYSQVYVKHMFAGSWKHKN